MALLPHQRYAPKLFTGSSHNWAIKICLDLPPATRLLDIGCGSAIMGRALGEKGFNELYAVEKDPQARQNAGRFYRQVEEGLEPFAAQSFDVILLLDVLEHLAEPLSFLQQALALLAPGGRALISVPNVAHWSVRLMLLLGFFEYTERGILDRTHLHFFTRRSFRRMLKELLGFKIKKQCSSIAPLEFALPEVLWNNRCYAWAAKIRLAAAQLWPGFLAYQHLAQIERERKT